ncbi:hypothetical protein SESBI_24622 [Sesbania bispinosa]|nr:hypothetical protein SESBI_24622 [Sesbania bispinosa]
MMMQIFPPRWRSFWDKWELRFVVLFSLSIQIILILLGNKRKYCTRSWLRFTLWSAYLLADWLATTSLGALSNKEGENKGGFVEPMYVIVALWAPLLLLHLGGPDTITAYSMEDNALWSRRLLSYSIQVVVALYIFLRSWTNTDLNILAIPIFIAGIIKIGERIWVLWSASSQQFKESLFPDPDPGPNYARYMETYNSASYEGFRVEVEGLIETPSAGGDHNYAAAEGNIIPLPQTDTYGPATTVKIAHKFLKISKLLFADLILSFQDVSESRSSLMNGNGKDVFEVMEVELGFMYDLFYTKAAAIYSFMGCVLRFVTLSCNISVLCAFFSMEKNQYPKVDVFITGVLLLGAIILEIYSVILLLSSDWTMLWLSKHKNRVTSKAISLIQFVKRKRWSNSIGQFNLISFCLLQARKQKCRIPCFKVGLKCCLARMIIGVWQSYQKYKHSDFEIVTPDLKEIIFQHFINKIKEVNKEERVKDEELAKDITGFCNDKGAKVLESFKYSNKLGWSVGVEFDQSILLWHVATDICYNSVSVEEDTNNGRSLTPREASKLLSEYMVYLLVMRPSMMPNGIGEIRFQDTCAEATEFVEDRYSIKWEKEVCQKLLKVSSEIEKVKPLKVKGDRSKSVLFDACRLAKQIRELSDDEDWETKKMWELISQVWVEMLGYAASHCQGIHHAQELRHGGELLTHGRYRNKWQPPVIVFCSVRNTSVFLQQRKELESNMNWVELLFWIALTAILFVSVALDCLVIFYEDKVKWIKRKLELLEALTKDYDQLVKKRDEVESGVRHLWELEDLSGGIHLQLSGTENEWVKSTGEVVSKAKRCVARYERHSLGPLLGIITAIFRSMPIISVICEIESVKREMRDHLQKKDEKAKEISKSMENSRSLLDQYKYIIEEADKSVAAQNQKQKQPSTSFEELMKKGEHIFSTMEERRSIYLLLPLHAFVKDLSQLQLETETEKLWKKEAEEVIEDAETLINNYLWWFDWFPIFSILKKFKMPILIVTHQFRKGMRRIVTEFDGLLKRKEKYNLAFIDRAAEKSIFPSIIDDKEITPAMKSIHSKLNNLQKSSKREPEMNSVCHALEEMYKQLQKAEETAGRNACVEQLKSIAQEVDNLLERYMNEPELKRQEIKNATDLLQKIIRICSIKRQKSTKVVGLKNEVRDLVSKLTTSSDNPSTLSIVGMKGVGKTTLAKAVYYKKAVVEHFPIRVWVTVTEGAATRAQVLLMDKHGTKDQTLDVTQVRDHLKEKLCLVVLDNVSKTEDFDKLDETLSGSGWTNGSRIVLTTRSKNVASHADSSSTLHHIHIRLLTMEESWALFVKVAGFEKKVLEPKVEKFARKVVGRCGGLPHEILSLGCVMPAKDITQENNRSWVLSRINHGRHREHWQQAWEKNREELMRGTLIEYLNYFTHFPVDFEIPARRLVNLWVAEGLVQQNDQQTPEDTAEGYLKELRDRNMIQVVALKSNAKIKTCRLPSILRQIILQHDRTSHNQHLGTHLERRFAYHFDVHGLDANSTQVLSKKGIPVSVFFFDKREGSKPGEQVGKILSTGIVSEQFLEIKVLDLERVFRPQLPESLGKLTNIKYLSLRWTYLEEFPLCICKLMELETLDLKHTCIRVIPSSIWKLKKLKNLYLIQKYRSRLEGKPSGKFEENLHTLWGVFLYGSYPLLRYLHKLKNLQKLKLAFQLTELEQDTVASKIVQLKQLNSLRLRSIDEDDKLRMSRLPQNLIDLTLSASKLSDDPMTELQNLPELKSLCLYADSYTGIKMVCASGSFRKLQVLRFWKLWNLQEWDVKDGAMPSLVEFEARFCGNLEYPTGLKHLKALRMVKLHEMSGQFIREIKRTLSIDVEIDFD